MTLDANEILARRKAGRARYLAEHPPAPLTDDEIADIRQTAERTRLSVRWVRRSPLFSGNPLRQWHAYRLHGIRPPTVERERLLNGAAALKRRQAGELTTREQHDIHDRLATGQVTALDAEPRPDPTPARTEQPSRDIVRARPDPDDLVERPATQAAREARDTLMDDHQRLLRKIARKVRPSKARANLAGPPRMPGRWTEPDSNLWAVLDSLVAAEEELDEESEAKHDPIDAALFEAAETDADNSKVDDWTQEAFAVALENAPKHNPELGAFSTFIEPRVRFALVDMMEWERAEGRVASDDLVHQVELDWDRPADIGLDGAAENLGPAQDRISRVPGSSSEWSGAYAVGGDQVNHEERLAVARIDKADLDYARNQSSVSLDTALAKLTAVDLTTSEREVLFHRDVKHRSPEATAKQMHLPVGVVIAAEAKARVVPLVQQVVYFRGTLKLSIGETAARMKLPETNVEKIETAAVAKLRAIAEREGRDRQALTSTKAQERAAAEAAERRAARRKRLTAIQAEVDAEQEARRGNRDADTLKRQEENCQAAVAAKAKKATRKKANKSLINRNADKPVTYRVRGKEVSHRDFRLHQHATQAAGPAAIPLAAE